MRYGYTTGVGCVRSGRCHSLVSGRWLIVELVGIGVFLLVGSLLGNLVGSYLLELMPVPGSDWRMLSLVLFAPIGFYLMVHGTVVQLSQVNQSVPNLLLCVLAWTVVALVSWWSPRDSDVLRRIGGPREPEALARILWPGLGVVALAFALTCAGACVLLAVA